MSDRLIRAAIAAAIAAIIIFFIVEFSIGLFCQSDYIFNNYTIKSEETAAIVSAGLGTSSFVFAYVGLPESSPDKFEKILALLVILSVLMWIGFVFVDDRLCLVSAWKVYALYLIAPSALASILMVGRRWIRQDD